MADEDKTTQAVDNGQTQAGSETNDTHKTDDLPQWARDAISKANQEAAGYRTKLRAIEDATRKADEDRAKEQGDYKKLYEGIQPELTELRGLKDKATAYETALTATLEARLKTVPKEMQSLIPSFGGPIEKLAWLDANASVFTARPAPRTDFGTQGTSGQSAVTLSAEEIQIAKRSGMTPEQYAASKAKINERKRQET